VCPLQIGAPLRVIPEPRAAADIAISSNGCFVALRTATTPQSLAIFQWVAENDADVKIAETLVLAEASNEGRTHSSTQ
jgi:hypothetical protein